jgi:hypothetical protein
MKRLGADLSTFRRVAGLGTATVGGRIDASGFVF